MSVKQKDIPPIIVAKEIFEDLMKREHMGQCCSKDSKIKRRDYKKGYLRMKDLREYFESKWGLIRKREVKIFVKEK